jgi:hypothetical protein
MWRPLLLLGLALALPACGAGGGDPAPAANNTSTTFSDPGIETFPDEGRTHVPVGTVIHYNTDPPTSGPHYPDPEPGGFYTTPIDPGFLVHSMEHGGVIIYYDITRVTASDLDALVTRANQHLGTFSQVVVVPRSDPTDAIILTAWTHWLRLSTFDASRIDGFITLFLGKGPESPP